MAQYAFYFDQTRCMSCNSCTVACKDWNQVEPGPVAWRKQFTYEKDGSFFPLSMSCNHCSDPACVKACAYSAISKDDFGVVSVDRSKCQKLLGCINACPFGKTLIADDKQEDPKLKNENNWHISHPMQKCDMCRERIYNGEKPACVASCVGRALDWGTEEYILNTYKDVERMNPQMFPFVYVNNNNDTKPNFYIKVKRGKDQPKITKLATGYDG